jgi:glycosyltransferase involved in cell wall biosynthesis
MLDAIDLTYPLFQAYAPSGLSSNTETMTPVFGVAVAASVHVQCQFRLFPVLYRRDSAFNAYGAAMPSVLIIVENLPVPLDRRVWQQATALVRAGFAVTVICPKAGKYLESYEELDGVQIFRHGLPVEGSGVLHYLAEYGWALVAEFFLTLKICFKRRVDVIQACNPPDNIFLIGLMCRKCFGTKFVFDHHDPFAALFALKFPKQRRLQKIVSWFERQSLRSADQVITTSRQLRKLAVDNYGVSHENIVLVRSGFDLRRVATVAADEGLKRGRKFLALYIGVMGPQDGIDLLLRAAAHLIHHMDRKDIHFVLAGGGSQFNAMVALSEQLGLGEWVEFTGYVEGSRLYQLLATADVGVSPDPKNDFNDKLSMNKILEYMAFSLPIVQFDLVEGKELAADAAMYAGENDPAEFASAIATLLDDPERRAGMGELGRTRISEMFSWSRQEEIYLGAYRSLLDVPVMGPAARLSDGRAL